MPHCAAGHIDLSETAFAALAPLPAGLISVSYSSLADPPLPGPVSLEVKQGSSRYWLALLADNTGNPLAAVQVRTPAGWLSLARASYNYWTTSTGAGPWPFTVRLTDTEGHRVTVSGITLSPGTVQSTGTWTYSGGTTTAPADSAPSLAATSAAPVAPAPAAPAPGTARAACPSPETYRVAAGRVAPTVVACGPDCRRGCGASGRHASVSQVQGGCTDAGQDLAVAGAAARPA